MEGNQGTFRRPVRRSQTFACKMGIMILSHKLLPRFNARLHFKYLFWCLVHGKGSVNVVILTFVGSLQGADLSISCLLL